MSETRAQKHEITIPEAVEDRLLRLLDPDPVRANQRYQRLFQKLVTLFAARRCSDPEKLAGETIKRVYQSLSAGLEIKAQVEPYLFGVAKNVLFEDYRRQRRAALPLDHLPVEWEPSVDPSDTLEAPKWQQELYHQCYQQCLQTLTEEQRAQLLLFYRGNQEGEMKRQRKQLASQLGITPRALSSRMLRLREKLDACIRNCVHRKQEE